LAGELFNSQDLVTDASLCGGDPLSLTVLESPLAVASMATGGLSGTLSSVNHRGQISAWVTTWLFPAGEAAWKTKGADARSASTAHT